MFENNKDNSNGIETVSLSASNCDQVLLDIGNLLSEIPSQSEIEKYVTNDHVDFPNILPKDINNQAQTILNFWNVKGKVHKRDWLVWSQHKQALFCFPCRLFSDNISKSSVTERNLSSRSVFASLGGYAATGKWRKILDVILFLGERGLAFRGSSQRIGDVGNDNFLGLIELHWDPILKEHVLSVKEFQRKGKRLQVHYLSGDNQNEFIAVFSNFLRQHVLQERRSTKYFAIMVDATPDSSHTEQTTFILQYVTLKDSQYEIVERFLTYVDCNNKTEISQMIVETFQHNSIPLSDCRAQAYDNGSNMARKYNGVQAKILQLCPLALFSPCGCHTLNLVGNDAAECIPEAVTFFGTIQTVYNFFSSSPKRWEILSKHINCSLKGMSHTRWSDRVESVKPFAAQLPGIKLSLEELLELNLTSKTRAEVEGAL
ncbi:uncharacterized protein LOC124811172 [Hydra vulgaris]|uniref:uncharacterized protein LOC124811171 n=1 Tax=Hydra vulgaris TaxID=6087 RepID=UPI001F5FC124|nr:uncharacterized protein LOC124811171 [Hydra vulgaris]XP_047132443.1 uncharacterized protein LOC124811172 [Hydra vulgaris]